MTEPIFYLDAAGKEHGPFPISSMVQWYQEGYFLDYTMMRTESETTHVPLMAHPAMASYLTNSISTNNNNNDNTNNTIDHTTILNTNHSKETTDSNENNSDSSKLTNKNEKEAEEDSGEESLTMLQLDGQDIAPPPGWKGVPLESNTEAVNATREQFASIEAAGLLTTNTAALTSTAAGGATSAYDITSAVDPARPWTDQEYEHWMAYSLRPENTLSIPPSIWTRLDLEKRERQRVAGLTMKYMKQHAPKIGRKKYSWSVPNAFKDKKN